MSVKLRRRIVGLLHEHGADVPMRAHENARAGSIWFDDGVLHGSVEAITTARNVRDNIFVPDLYSGEESTWA